MLKNSLCQKGHGFYEKIKDLFIKYLEMNKESQSDIQNALNMNQSELSLFESIIYDRDDNDYDFEPV